MTSLVAAAGAVQVRAAVDAAELARCRAAIDAHPAWQSRAGSGFVAAASSLPLASVLDPARVAAAVAAGPAGGALRAAARGPVALLGDACWVRRQYAPGRQPPRHAAHAWHQDGALGVSFGDRSVRPTLRAIVTCWIALDPCGVDAPGLEFAVVEEDEEDRIALPPQALSDAAVRARHRRFDRPVLAPGDALVFRGATLHRTHLLPAMTRDRTSIEIRFEETRT